ncbi:MAG: hypothetical protein FWH14_01140 [Oscillospiraceae bacterium]|nr:hypothetical protein [Oscillospiraceae bacterium]
MDSADANYFGNMSGFLMPKLTEGKRRWKKMSGIDGRKVKVKVRGQVFSCSCGIQSSIYAVKCEKNTDGYFYTDCKCYRCGKRFKEISFVKMYT